VQAPNPQTRRTRRAPCRDKEHYSLDSYFVIDSFVDILSTRSARRPLLAYSTLAMLASATMRSQLSSLHGASCECEVDGNVPVTLQNVHAKIDAVERQ